MAPKCSKGRSLAKRIVVGPWMATGYNQDSRVYIYTWQTGLHVKAFAWDMESLIYIIISNQNGKMARIKANWIKAMQGWPPLNWDCTFPNNAGVTSSKLRLHISSLGERRTCWANPLPGRLLDVFAHGLRRSTWNRHRWSGRVLEIDGNYSTLSWWNWWKFDEIW